MKPLISFLKVKKEYLTGTSYLALHDTSFEIYEKEFTVLAGPSGSGKTTVLNLAAGLDKPSSGIVTLLNTDISNFSSKEAAALRRGKIGFVFQSHNLLPVLTALENVEYPLVLQKIPAKERKERALEALAEVGLIDFQHRKPKELSGGQQQRIAVARAIVTSPQIIFADEPTASLDSRSSEKLVELFKKINTNFGTSFLFSSHDPHVITKANRIISLLDGKINEDKTQHHLSPSNSISLSM